MDGKGMAAWFESIIGELVIVGYGTTHKMQARLHAVSDLGIVLSDYDRRYPASEAAVFLPWHSIRGITRTDDPPADSEQ